MLIYAAYLLIWPLTGSPISTVLIYYFRMNSRVIEGAKWILTSPNQSITIKAWQKKFGVVLETARQDLFKLEDAGIVHRKLVKRQYVFEVKK